ncbi:MULTISPECIES: hypothetical protein [unclassified Tenacibaculum]|uniref:hypothetical protein n=1 Tax=unclassified Tenacibaculum TaxID=2635139 RepID=UPI001F201B4D|nr:MULTISPECIES: hypothetical protein [unclassified Tenacibaculum]MCF2875441.1 hypothetical protein [Tenacibaculum sp. Cn5-1]MCF2935517.1 hypothetical protein [Tenacibaculum sp. Cn5-34]MCG7512077.1 hypothetical protein [Tenacibaculum sp. Cn5-46]
MSLNEINELYSKAQNSLAYLTSKVIRSRHSKKERMFFLYNLKEPLTKGTLIRIKKIALENEDYETCEVIKIYARDNNIVID